MNSWRDEASLRDVRPDALESLLHEFGWERVSVSEGAASLWAPDGDPELARVVIPLNPENRDYLRLMREALEDATTALSEEPGRLWNSLVGFSADRVWLRCLLDTGSDGSIPLTAGRGLVRAGEKLLVASAAATEQRKAYFGNSKTQRASGIGNKVRLGQTEVGSYTLTLLVREPSLPESSPDQSRIPAGPRYSFERRTLTTLATALAATRGAVEEYERGRSVGRFIEGIPDGVSADFCEALLEIGSVPQSRGVSFSFDWARNVPPHRELPREVSFGREAGPALEAAAERLRPNTDLTEYRLLGQVTQLRRREGDEDGLATILSAVGGRERSVLVPVSGQLHSEAIHAYEEREFVALRGELVSEGNRLYLLNAHDWQRVS